MNYEKTGNALADRIVALGPQVLTLDSPWALFKVPGFDCSDLAPSFGQACWALGKAKSVLRLSAPTDGDPTPNKATS